MVRLMNTRIRINNFFFVLINQQDTVNCKVFTKGHSFTRLVDPCCFLCSPFLMAALETKFPFMAYTMEVV